MTLSIDGIWSPMPTPFRADGGLDERRVGELTDRLIEGGVDGLFPLGTTGEFALLDRAERRRVVELVVARAGSRVPVLAGVSDPSPKNAASFAKDAADAGADGVVATPPYYYKVDDEGLYRHFKLIHDSITLPLILYNIPEWTHNFVPLSVVSRLAEDGVVAGMKYTEYNMLNLLKFIRGPGRRIAVLTGSDAMTLPCLEAGGRGAVISVSNILPKEASSIYDLFKAGKQAEAREAQESILPAIEAAGVGYFPAGVKEAMKVVGFPVGPVRPPQTPLTESEIETVRSLMGKTERQMPMGHSTKRRKS
jgi:4-hydroxy-tetrahydrodipicolinate synthase